MMLSITYIWFKLDELDCSLRPVGHGINTYDRVKFSINYGFHTEVDAYNALNEILNDKSYCEGFDISINDEFVLQKVFSKGE